MQCSSVGCSLAQWKNIRPCRPEFGPKGKHFVSGNSFFMGGGSREAQKDGCAQRTGAHTRPKPTSQTYAHMFSLASIPFTVHYNIGLTHIMYREELIREGDMMREGGGGC